MAEHKSYNFGPGNPDPSVFPSQDLADAASRAINRLGRTLAQYPEQRGLPELRAVAQARFERNHHVRPALEEIVITNGAMQGLQLSAQGLARPGDGVVLEEFEYVGTIRVFKQCGLQLVPVAIDDEGMRMDALETLLDEQAANGRKPAFIYTTASYQNPTGTSQPVERRQRLLELARQHQILIVEDDTYADITFEPQRAPAIYSLAKPGEVLYIGSFSKILGPGVRLGFFIADESIIARLLPWKMDGGTSMLSQMIAAEYFKDHLWDHIEEGRQAVKDKRNALLDSLESEFGSVPGMSWTRPDGGLFLWITLPPEIDRVRLQQLATDAGIVYSTGQAFNATNQDVPNIRLAFGWIEREDIPEAIRTLASCVRAAMPARVAP